MVIERTRRYDVTLYRKLPVKVNLREEKDPTVMIIPQ